MDILRLPNELIVTVFLHLEDKTDINSFSKINKRINTLYEQEKNVIYKRIVNREYREIDFNNYSDIYDLLRLNSKHGLVLNYIHNGIFNDFVRKNIDIQDKFRNTILMTVIDKGPIYNIKIVDRILELKPNLNLQDKRGNTVLMKTIKNVFNDGYYMDVLNKLLDVYKGSKSDINIQNNGGETALMIALRYNNSYGRLHSAISKLLELYKDNNGSKNTMNMINTKNNKGKTALFYILDYIEDWNIIPFLNTIKQLKPDPNVQDDEGNTALMSYILKTKKIHDKKVLNILLDMKPDLTIKNNNGESIYDIINRKLLKYIRTYTNTKKYLKVNHLG